MAYDAADQYVLLFGGYNETVGALADTWKFVGGAWTELSPTTHPAALSTGTMSYDAKDGYVVFFDSTPSTWKFVGGVWTELSPATHPTSRQFEMMDYDAHDGYVLLFGGYGSSEVLGDTWTFTGGDWTELSPTTSPPARYGGAMAYSAINGEVVLFGGHLGSGMISDTWKFAGGVWTKISSEANPSERSYLAAADGTSTASLVVFGGVSASVAYLNETWTFQGIAWTHVLPREPVARYGDSLAYDQKDGYVVLFGGVGESTDLDLGDTWTFSNGVWTALNPAVSPSPRAYASMAYDAADGYVVLFGGLAGRETDLGDTWTFSGGVWTNITSVSSAFAPPSRDSAAMTYDYADGYVVLFGGENLSATILFSDTWSFSAGTWSPLSPASSPAARAGPAMTYDSENGYVLLFSGYQFTTEDTEYLYADTWSFVGGQWTNLTSSLSSEPPSTIYGGMADDTYDGYPLMFGGTTLGGDVSTSWEFTGSGWTELAPAHNPGVTDSVGMTFDPVGNYVILFGGFPQTYQGNTWTY